MSDNQKPHLVLAIQHNDVSTVRTLLRNGSSSEQFLAIEDVLDEETGVRAIHLANSPSMLAMLVDEFQAEVDSKCVDGSTALMRRMQYCDSNDDCVRVWDIIIQT